MEKFADLGGWPETAFYLTLKSGVNPVTNNLHQIEGVKVNFKKSAETKGQMGKKRLSGFEPVAKREIRFYHSADFQDFDTAEFAPISSFSLSLEINIGEVGSDGSDVFQIMVLSPDKAIQYRYDKMIVLPVLDIVSIKMIVSRLVEHCNGLEDPMIGLRRYFDWEYEGMI